MDLSKIVRRLVPSLSNGRSGFTAQRCVLVPRLSSQDSPLSPHSGSNRRTWSGDRRSVSLNRTTEQLRADDDLVDRRLSRSG